jgi:hypothetical protein
LKLSKRLDAHDHTIRGLWRTNTELKRTISGLNGIIGKLKQTNDVQNDTILGLKRDIVTLKEENEELRQVIGGVSI